MIVQTTTNNFYTRYKDQNPFIQLKIQSDSLESKFRFSVCDLNINGDVLMKFETV